jgi:poly(hydroxyalkanoate) depolymerase family esterase
MITAARGGQSVLGTVAPGAVGKGAFLSSAGEREYHLFVPHVYGGQRLPLVVMLHGCKQDATDFAAGTRMNVVADEFDCFVLYPQQSKAANPSRCWNWFMAHDQRRNQGEPLIIADLTREVIRAYGIDDRRVFVAGMSAGGAMAATLGATYPDLFSAIGVHSGLPYRAAGNLWSALSAMKVGTEDDSLTRSAPMRTIVFHGSEDGRVHPRNGEQVITQFLGSRLPGTSPSEPQAGEFNGRAYERTLFRDSRGDTQAEQWLIHGAGHAWSGGGIDGSYTDAMGPDASREMLRFFLEEAS